MIDRVGHREDLLAGAKECLRERGYARTTARDIVAASGTNLASIGYHFGSKEALLTEALNEAFDEWGEELARVAVQNADSEASLADQLEVMWTWVIESFTTMRPMMAANMEAFAEAQHSPELRTKLADYYERSRADYVEKSKEITGLGGETARAVGSFHLALLDGLMLQWLIDPERAPSARDLADAWRAMLDMSPVQNPRTSDRAAP